MSVKAMQYILARSLSPPIKLLALVLAYHYNDEAGQAWPGLDLLAAETGYLRRHIQRLIIKLEKEGVIAVDRGGGGRVTNRYRFPGLGEVSPRTSLPDEGCLAGHPRDVLQDIPGVSPRTPKRESNRIKRKKPTINIEYPLDFPFETLLPTDYDKVPELNLFHKVTRRIPGTPQLSLIVRAIRDNGLAQETLRTAYHRWVARGYRVDNLAWLEEWAPAVKRGEQPWLRNGGAVQPKLPEPIPEPKSEEEIRAERAADQAEQAERVRRLYDMVCAEPGIPAWRVQREAGVSEIPALLSVFDKAGYKVETRGNALYPGGKE